MMGVDSRNRVRKQPADACDRHVAEPLESPRCGEWSYTTPGLHPTTLTAEGSSVHNPNAFPPRLLDLDNEYTRTIRGHRQAGHTTSAPVGLHDL